MTQVHTGPTPEGTVRCIIDFPDANANTAVQPVFVNGAPFPIVLNEPFEAPQAVYEALLASSLSVRQLPAGEGSSPDEVADEGAADGPGGSDGGAEPQHDPLDHDGDGEKGGSLPADPPALKGKTKAQLLEIAADEGVDTTGLTVNAAIIKAIEAKRASAPAATQE